MSACLLKEKKIITKSKLDRSCGNEKVNQLRKVFLDKMDVYSIKSFSSAKVRRNQKRFRSAFTTLQVAIMEQEFRKNPYVTNAQREQMANRLHLSERAIKIWFQNRRMKEKRDPSKSLDSEETTQISLDIYSKQNTISTTRTSPSSTKSKHQNNEVSNDPDCKYEIKIYNNHKHEKDNHPEVKSNDLIVSKISKDKKLEIPKVYDYSSGGSVRKVDIKPIDLVDKTCLVTDRPVQQKQPVGHILPFSQIVSSEPQKSPENLTFKINKEQVAPVPKPILPETSQSQYPGYLPLDLSKYYTPVPPVNTWNRLNFIPLIASPHQGLQYNPSSSITTETPPPSFKPSNNCCCDCHSSSAAAESQILQASYPLVYTQYIPHIMAQMPPQYTNNKF